MEQWNLLKESIEKEGVKVVTLNQVEGQPDMVFACLVHNNKIFLSKYRHKERTGEQKYFAAFYKQLGLQLFGEDYPEFFEGGGDAVFSDKNTLWAGWGGPRTDKKAYDNIRLMGGNDFEIIFCELIDQRFYHLDTCFCPVGANSALCEEEALNFVCNAINIRKKVISPKGVSKQTLEALTSLGYSLEEVEMSEFMKSGGACQCLVMKL
uniref:Amidinotransferase n=1 Tax=Meloidogyne javanica TaxID=6303 RepID=A0A915LEZ7_MELJA